MDPRPRKRRRARDAVDQTSSLATLSTHALRVELHRRHLSVIGLRPQLQSRLRTALSSQHAHISVPKKMPVPTPFASLHVQTTVETARHPLPALLRARSVWVCTDAHVATIWLATRCGKGNLSRSAPSFNALAHAQYANWKGRAMRQLHQLQQQTQLQTSPQLRTDVEHLQLTLVEAFYLAFITKQILIYQHQHHSEPITDPNHVWRLFCARCNRFPLLFVAYCRYRAAGWLPKSGLKYGVNWVLYPTKRYTHTHAPYCIVFNFSDNTNDTRLESSWIALQNRLRLVKNVAKTLVIARLHVNHNLDFATSISATFDAVHLTELTIDRWLP